jgi:sulfur carrier protein ThiS
MEIKAVLLPRENEEKVLELADGSTGMELLRELNLPYDVHILARDDVPIPLDVKLIDGEKIRIISVVSGG